MEKDSFIPFLRTWKLYFMVLDEERDFFYFFSQLGEACSSDIFFCVNREVKVRERK